MNHFRLKGLFKIVCLVAFFSLIGCKNIVQSYDSRLVDQLLSDGYISKAINSPKENIHYFDNQKEEKPVIIFVHGFGGDGKLSWRNQAKEFQEDYRVLIPDILWFGQSSSLDKPTLAAQIEMIKKIVETEKLSNIHLVGISYGGFISLGFAHNYPNYLSSLTLVDSPGAAMSDEEIIEFCNRVGAETVQDAFIPETGEEVKRLMNFVFHLPPPLTTSLLDKTIGVYFSVYPEEQAKLLDELPSNRDWIKGKVSVPTLILWGREDQVFLVGEARELQERIGGELVIIDNAGHALPEEQPKRFNESLKVFVEQIEQTENNLG
jgi:pimeloyl-ACP methyl ester carboxylesterase